VKLSPHFDSREFHSHDGVRAPSNYLLWARHLCEDMLEPLREEFGPVTVVSGFRSAKHNKSVGGAPASYHLGIRGRRGAAADVTCARGTPDQWHAFLDGRGAHGLGRYPSFVHVDNRAGRSRW
jgi:uncharacterized protein YcbK (DUF882 family)